MGGDVFVPSALIASAGNNANEYLAKHVAELGYLRPTIVASGGEARRRMGDIDFEVVIINTPCRTSLATNFDLCGTEKSNASVILLAKAASTADQIPINCSSTVLVLAKPLYRVQFATFRMAAACCRRLDYLRQKTTNCGIRLPRSGWWTVPSGLSDRAQGHERSGSPPHD